METVRDKVGIGPAAQAALAKLDPDRPLKKAGLLADRNIEADIAAGRIIPVQPRRPRAKLPPGHARIGEHIQTPDEDRVSWVPKAVLDECVQSGGYMPKGWSVQERLANGGAYASPGKITAGPLDPARCRYGIPAFLDHPPFKGAKR